MASVVRAGSRIEYEVTADGPLPGWMREVMLQTDGHALAFQLLADAGEMSPLSDLGLFTAPAPLLVTMVGGMGLLAAILRREK